MRTRKKLIATLRAGLARGGSRDAARDREPDRDPAGAARASASRDRATTDMEICMARPSQ
jgi:hypothetical protein